MSLRIERAHGSVTLQGAPETGRRRFGVPPGGAFDCELAARLNRLVGNAPGALVLELALCALEATALAGLELAWAGAPGGPEFPARVVAGLAEGDRLRCAPPAAGARLWVAVAGGFRRAERPGAGAILELGEAGAERDERSAWPDRSGSGPLRYVPAPEAPAELAGVEFTVSWSSDRVGLRLDGPRFPHALERPSRPATFGTLQATPSGEVILFGPDGPTLGGYPQLGTVAGADVHRIAQLRPGEPVSFAPIDLETARGATSGG